MKHGEGRLLFDGGEYKGHFETDKFNGFGNLTTNENELYEGEFKEGIYHGSGKLIK